MNWLLLAFIAPFLWAIVAVLDTYFVHGVYKDEYDGAVISGLFQFLPWILVPFGVVSFSFLPWRDMVVMLVAGGLFLISSFTYFRALFVSNDSTIMQILWNLSVLFVPLMAWIMLGEHLGLVHYIGIGLAFIGISIFFMDSTLRRQGLSQILWLMLLSVSCLSISMVLSRDVYDNTSNFMSAFLVFSLGATLTSLSILVFDKLTMKDRIAGIIALSRSYLIIFILAEGLAIVGTLTSQKAIEISPSVSFVATIESLSPVIVMFLSLFLVFAFKVFGRAEYEATYQEQYKHFGVKIASLVIIVSGIYLIS